MSLQEGRRVMVSEYGETPLQAVEQFMRLETLPAPVRLEGNEVWVAIRSASVGWVDLIMASGQYQHMVEPPYCPGLEYSGVVEAVGPEVERFAIGDRVLVDGLSAGPRSAGAYQRYGGYASYALAPETALFAVPSRFDFDQACCFLGSYETAYHCLIHRGRLQAGETVLIHGASGATGLAAVHVAKLLGATVIATGRSEDKLAVVKEQGADHTIACTGDSSGPRSLRAQVKELTSGRGVQVVYDGVGGAISLESLRCVEFGARYLIVGWAGTPFVAQGKGGRGAPNANMLPTNLIMMKGLDVLGCPTVISTENDPSIREGRLQTIFAWIADGKLVPYVSHRFALDDFKEALRAKWSGQVIGGCVLHPN